MIINIVVDSFSINQLFQQQALWTTELSGSKTGLGFVQGDLLEN